MIDTTCIKKQSGEDFIKTWFPAYGDRYKSGHHISAIKKVEELFSGKDITSDEWVVLRDIFSHAEVYHALNDAFHTNGNAGSFLKGYGAERIWRKAVLDKHKLISNVKKQDDHDLSAKGDFALTYKDKHRMLAEVKVVGDQPTYQHGTLKWSVDIGHRDKKMRKLPNGEMHPIKHIYRGEYDFIALNFYNLFGEHRWAYAACDDLPDQKIAADDPISQFPSGHFIKSSYSQPWPLEETFRTDLDWVLERVVKKRKEKEDEKMQELQKI